MPIVETSGLIFLAVVTIGNYFEAWKQTSARYRTRKAYSEMMMSCVYIQTLDEFFRSFSKYRRRLTKEECKEYERLQEKGEKWIETVRPQSANLPLLRLEEQAAEAKALLRMIEQFMEPYKKAVVGYSAAELASIFEFELPFFDVDFD